MKGVIFTSFLDMVDELFGWEMTEKIVPAANSETGGAYSAVGTYDHMELINMVIALGKETTVPVPQLVKTFGEDLFGKLATAYPHFIKEGATMFEFLETVDRYIHVEVVKLYPDAVPPKFDFEYKADGELEVIYHSPRCLGDVAEGLLTGCAKYFNETIDIARERLSEDGSTERFTLRKVVKKVA